MKKSSFKNIAWCLVRNEPMNSYILPIWWIFCWPSLFTGTMGTVEWLTFPSLPGSACISCRSRFFEKPCGYGTKHMRSMQESPLFTWKPRSAFILVLCCFTLPSSHESRQVVTLFQAKNTFPTWSSVGNSNTKGNITALPVLASERIVCAMDIGPWQDNSQEEDGEDVTSFDSICSHHLVMMQSIPCPCWQRGFVGRDDIAAQGQRDAWIETNLTLDFLSVFTVIVSV